MKPDVSAYSTAASAAHSFEAVAPQKAWSPDTQFISPRVGLSPAHGVQLGSTTELVPASFAVFVLYLGGGTLTANLKK